MVDWYLASGHGLMVGHGRLRYEVRREEIRLAGLADLREQSAHVSDYHRVGKIGDILLNGGDVVCEHSCQFLDQVRSVARLLELPYRAHDDVVLDAIRVDFVYRCKTGRRRWSVFGEP